MQESRKAPVYDKLGIGMENAVSTEDLLTMTGYKSARSLQSEIAEERKQGFIICSGSGRGYWRPASREETERFIRNMESRAKMIFLACRSARQALELPEGQLEIDLDRLIREDRDGQLTGGVPVKLEKMA